MKKHILTIVFFSFMLAAFSQDLDLSEVPPMAKNSLKTNFPQAQKVNWSKEDGKYIANFFSDKVETSAYFDRTGTLLKTAKEWPSSQMPTAALGYVRKNFPEDRIMGCIKIVDNTNRVRFIANLRDIDLIFNEDGQRLEKE